MSICACPNATALPTIPSVGCASDFGQIQKIAFQRIHSSGTTKNAFSTTAKITALASWTALTAEDDGTKVVVTPFVEAPTADGGDAITFGGGNDTLGGIVKTIGRNPVNMTFALNQFPQNVISAMKEMQCETDLGVFLFNEAGQIMAVKGSGDDDFSPIPIRNLFIGDLMLNGLSNPDSNAMSFSFPPNWSDSVQIVTPAFNPLTDL